MSDVKIYSKPNCPYCKAAILLLSHCGIEDIERLDVSKDKDTFERMKEESGGRTTVPQIFIKGRHIGGFDDLKKMIDSGKLGELLDVKKPDTDVSVERVLIVGSGPAGLTAAIYASRAMLNPLVIDGLEPGGQLTTTSEVENYPGFEEGIDGPVLMDRMRKQARRFGARFKSSMVQKVEFDRDSRLKIVELSNKDIIICRVLIIATGASAKYLGIESEAKYKGKGVSACATCDGFFFRDQKVAVVGGGDTAAEEALFLTRFASKVVLIHRRDELRASQIMQTRLKENPKIEFRLNKVVEEVLGDGMKVTGAKLKDTKTGEITEENFDGIFIAIGHKPNTEPFADILPLDERGYIKTEDGRVKTNLEGVYACGDVCDPDYRQAVTAAGMGCMAAIEAERYLASLKK